MDRITKSFLLITIFSLLATETAFSQNKNAAKKKLTDYIKITDEEGKNMPFVFKSTAKFEIQNGILNISILSKNNTLLEINGINEKAVKDTTLSDASFKMIYIISQNEKAFASNPINSKSILTIKCSKAKKGNPISIFLKGNLFRDGKILSIDVKLSGQIPEIKSTTTRKIN